MAAPSSSLVQAATPYAFTGRFFACLARAGVRHVVVSPGSRSTPLAVAARWQPSLRCWVEIDERCAAFFALGLARASREPVALVCTSGTAAANYLPAIVEANHSRVPLVVLTADRPPELRDWDAGQTIDQLKLYGGQVRWFAELPVPGDEASQLGYAARLASRAVAEARGQGGCPGPVHLNWPLREPLEPAASDAAALTAVDVPASASVAAALRAPGLLPAREIEFLCALFRGAPRGVIACGPMDPEPALAEALLTLAQHWGWPLLADPASNLRTGEAVGKDSPVIASSEFLLRSQAFAAAHAPELVLRFGSTPVSKAQRSWLEAYPPRELVVVDPHGGFRDPSHLATRTLAADPEALCRACTPAAGGPADPAWLRGWREADARASEAIELQFGADEALLEPRAVRELCDVLPDDAILYVSNSMPIRHLDACLPASRRRLRVLANRGANGIDGMVSSALGAAAANRGRTVLLTGDLAFVHDLGGMLCATRHGLRLTIVLLDNDGGGIFSFLPIAARGEDVHFEELFRTRHGLDFEHAARLFGASYHRTRSLAHYRTALKDALHGEGLSIVHVPCERDASVAQFRALAAAVARSAEAARA